MFYAFSPILPPTVQAHYHHNWAQCTKGSFRFERSRTECSKDRNKAIADTAKLQRSNSLICFTEHILKRIKNESLLHNATLKLLLGLIYIFNIFDPIQHDLTSPNL